MKIVCENKDKSIGIIIFKMDLLDRHSLKNIALKTVPEGLPYWIVNDDEIPTDRTFRDAWEVPTEWGKPQGFGSKYNSYKELENVKNQSE